MSEPTQSERDALEALGYSEQWLESGLLDRTLLAAQYERLRSGGTKKTGRYRAEAFTTWLEAQGPVDEAQLDSFLSLAACDADPKVAQSAIATLIQSPRISLEQLERIARSDPRLMKRHEPLIRRTYLSRRLDEEVTDELIGQVIDGRDAAIQTRLVRDPRLTRKQAERLAAGGANPTIRQNANAWFQDKKAWRGTP